MKPDSHERAFYAGFRILLRELVNDSFAQGIRKGLKEGRSASYIADSLPFFDRNRPDTFPVWKSFSDRMMKVYRLVINDIVRKENKRMGWRVETLKADRTELSLEAEAFARQFSLGRAVDMSDSEKDRIRGILGDGIARNLTTKTMVDRIKDTVGITRKQSTQIFARLDRMEEEFGRMTYKERRYQAALLSEKVRLQRARAIARTEITRARAYAQKAVWESAREGGLYVDPPYKSWITAMDDRVSERCQELTALDPIPMDADFVVSDWAGWGPPSHVNCRCRIVFDFEENE